MSTPGRDNRRDFLSRVYVSLPGSAGCRARRPRDARRPHVRSTLQTDPRVVREQQPRTNRDPGHATPASSPNRVPPRLRGARRCGRLRQRTGIRRQSTDTPVVAVTTTPAGLSRCPPRHEPGQRHPLLPAQIRRSNNTTSSRPTVALRSGQPQEERRYPSRCRGLPEPPCRGSCPRPPARSRPPASPVRPAGQPRALNIRLAPQKSAMSTVPPCAGATMAAAGRRIASKLAVSIASRNEISKCSR